MKWQFLILLSLAALVVAQEEQDELKLAEPCDPEACQLPDCRCSSTAIPGGLAPRDTPQFVMVTFDDGVNVLNIETYRDILYNRVNTNGCKAGATFYVNHEYTNYQLVNELFNNGFEIALHSVSHQTSQSYWAEATAEQMRQEFVDQIDLVSHFANIPKDQLKGIRIPFLQLNGNSSFQVIGESSLVYDCSWPTISHLNPGLWPYTLDYASTQDCIIPPCPTASIPGAWVLPMVSWIDLNGGFCSMVDGCFWMYVPPLNDEEGWFKFILGNFERHYLGTRAPFGFFVHEWYISANPAVKNAMIRFLDLINNLHDVFMVNSADVIEWVKDPVPLGEYINKPCKASLPAACNANSCGPLAAPHKEEQFYMQICSTCPNVYPWLNNPLGQ